MRKLPAVLLIILMLAVGLVPFASAQTTVLTQTILGGQGRTGGSPPPPPNNPSGGPFTTPGTSLVIAENWWTNIISFRALVGPNVTAVTWYFGDGASANGITTTHTYQAPSFYQTYAARAHICTPTMCEDLWQTVQVFNGPLIVLAGVASFAAVVVGLVLASVLRHPPRVARGLARSRMMRRHLQLGGRVHARTLRGVRTIRMRRVRGR